MWWYRYHPVLSPHPTICVAFSETIEKSPKGERIDIKLGGRRGAGMRSNSDDETCSFPCLLSCSV